MIEELVSKVEKLKSSEVSKAVLSRIDEFARMGGMPAREIFKELCFCIMTANFQAERSIFIQREIGDGFLDLPEENLGNRLSELGHRFPFARARYIAEARRHIDSLSDALGSFEDESALRDWLAENVKGLGMKEASHFLRNIGRKELAILDFHILDILDRHGIASKPKSLSRKKYLEIEAALREFGKRVNLSLAELDLYLWYLETGKILK